MGSFFGWVLRRGAVAGVALWTAGAPVTAGEGPQTAPTLAQWLGFPPGARVLVVHGDDMGLCQSANAGTLQALTEGRASSASIMVPCPWFPDAARIARARPELDLGLHLTLNCEWNSLRWAPVAGRARVPGLVDPEGFMWRSAADVLQHATPEEVEIELRAQIELALQNGLRPTHLDTHMGTVFATPAFFDVYRRLANEYGIPYMAPRIVPPADNPLERARNQQYAALAQQLTAGGELLLDFLQTDAGGESLEARIEYWADQVRRLAPGVTQFIIHCGIDNPELAAITGSHRSRDWDRQAWCSPQLRAAIEETGVILTTWRELGRRRALAQASLSSAEPAAESPNR